MLFNSCFKDNTFILDVKKIYHTDFHTSWKIDSIKKVSRGFHIKLNEVNDYETAQFFIGESFSIPEKDIEDKSMDLLQGAAIYNPDGEKAGKISSISQTPSYLLAEVTSVDGNIFYIPLSEGFISKKEGKLILLKELEDEN